MIQDNRSGLSKFFRNNNVTIMFVVLCLFAYYASGTNLTFLMPELITRISRNAFLVMSLLIPVVAGLGMNFGIVIGAMAAQISIFLVVLWGFTGITGFLLCVAISTPLSILFGYLVGKLFNSMKGTELIGGLVAGYFADGLYQLLFLFILGGLIPINNTTLMISTGVGVKNAINLERNMKYALDNIPMLSILEIAFWAGLALMAGMIIYRLIKKQDLQLKKLLLRFVPVAVAFALSFIPSVEKFLSTPRLMLLNAIEYGCAIGAVYCIYKIVTQRQNGGIRRYMIGIAVALVVYASTYIPPLYDALIVVHLPVMTFLCIAGMWMFMPWFLNTKLGQDMRTVGKSRAVAASAGIDVNRTRIIATIISTVLAGYGQLISLQNIGTVATYGSHLQVGLYAVAALLVGGASQSNATVRQALLGIVLFHTLFILAPVAGKQMLGNAQIGEYFRVFVTYGVIALSLVLHSWEGRGRKKSEDWTTFVQIPGDPPSEGTTR